MCGPIEGPGRECCQCFQSVLCASDSSITQRYKQYGHSGISNVSSFGLRQIFRHAAFHFSITSTGISYGSMVNVGIMTCRMFDQTQLTTMVKK